MARSAKGAGRTASELARPRAVLFDWDGTLVDCWAAIHAALETTFRAMGLEPWMPDETRRRVRKSMRDAFPELFGDRWEEAGEVFYRSYGAVHLERITPLPGAPEMLEALARSDLYLGVVSNKNGKYLRSEARHLGWQGYFGRLVGAMDAAEDKPSKLAVSCALEGSGIPMGHEVWLVGDALIDLECAANSGCAGVLLGKGEDGVAEGRLAPAMRFAGCADLAANLGRA